MGWVWKGWVVQEAVLGMAEELLVLSLSFRKSSTMYYMSVSCHGVDSYVLYPTMLFGVQYHCPSTLHSSFQNGSPDLVVRTII